MLENQAGPGDHKHWEDPFVTTSLMLCYLASPWLAECPVPNVVFVVTFAYSFPSKLPKLSFAVLKLFSSGSSRS